MLAKRIIPCLDVDRGRVVKGTHFVNLVDAGDPVENAKRYDEEGADEIVFLDITASSDGRETMVDVVRRTQAVVFVPFTVGGGIRSLEDIRRVLEAGADKVSVNSAAVRSPDLVADAARRFGAQCVVVAIDARRTPNGYETYVDGGRTATGSSAPGLDTRCARCDRMGETGRSARGGRDPPHEHGSRRHAGRLRCLAYPGSLQSGQRTRDRLRRRRLPRPPRRGTRRWQGRRRAGGIDLPFRSIQHSGCQDLPRRTRSCHAEVEGSVHV